MMILSTAISAVFLLWLITVILIFFIVPIVLFSHKEKSQSFLHWIMHCWKEIFIN